MYILNSFRSPVPRTTTTMTTDALDLDGSNSFDARKLLLIGGRPPRIGFSHGLPYQGAAQAASQTAVQGCASARAETCQLLSPTLSVRVVGGTFPLWCVGYWMPVNYLR